MRTKALIVVAALTVVAVAACAPMGSIADWRRAFEVRKSQEIERLLEARVGTGAARAQVAAKLDDKGRVLSLSVAVLVDYMKGIGADGKTAYFARTFEELEMLTALVKTAVGFDEKRGDSLEVHNMRFSDPAK